MNDRRLPVEVQRPNLKPERLVRPFIPTGREVNNALMFAHGAFNMEIQQVLSKPEIKRTKSEKQKLRDYADFSNQAEELRFKKRPQIQVNIDGKTISTKEWIQVEGVMRFMEGEVARLEAKMKLPNQQNNELLKVMLDAYQKNLRILKVSAISQDDFNPFVVRTIDQEGDLTKVRDKLTKIKKTPTTKKLIVVLPSENQAFKINYQPFSVDRTSSIPQGNNTTRDIENKKSFKELNQELRDQYLEIWRRSLDKRGRVQIDSFATGNGKYYWQEVAYGGKTKKESSDLYRGYLMIEPEDFPKALNILRKVGEQRLREGKKLNMKWLMMTVPDRFRKDPAYRENANNLGSYGDLKPTDPRIAIYGDSLTDVKEILEVLAEHPEWQEIEKNRLIKYGGATNNAPRRPGSNALTHNGKEFRTLNWNKNPGHSSDESKDPDWRRNKVGEMTVLKN